MCVGGTQLFWVLAPPSDKSWHWACFADNDQFTCLSFAQFLLTEASNTAAVSLRPFPLKDRVWLCLSKMCSNPLPSYLGALTLWELPGFSPQEESVSLPCANSAVPVVHACVKPVSQPFDYVPFFKIRYWKFYRNFFPDMKIKIVQGWDKSLSEPRRIFRGLPIYLLSIFLISTIDSKLSGLSVLHRLFILFPHFWSASSGKGLRLVWATWCAFESRGHALHCFHFRYVDSLQVHMTY